MGNAISVNLSRFELALPTRITFGVGRRTEVPRIVAALGSRVLIVTGSTPARVQGILDDVARSTLENAVVTIAHEPTVTDARAAVAAGMGVQADVVLAIGGGSAIDLGKAAAALLAQGSDPLDHLEVVGMGRPLTVSSLPMVAVPTTAGTGSEVTANAVLSAPESQLKTSLRHPSMVPTHAVIDPELALACPPQVTAASGMDALTQCLEPFVSNRANPVTDGWALTGLSAAGRSLQRAYVDGNDRNARSDMALSALMGGLALANAKLGAVHGFAGVVGGVTGASHGAICGALLAPVCLANLQRATPELHERFVSVARSLTGDPRAEALDGIEWIQQCAAILQIPRLGELGLTDTDLEPIVAQAAVASSMQGNPVQFTPQELEAVLRAAI